MTFNVTTDAGCSCALRVSTYSTEANFVFTGPGAFEDSASCPQGCDTGFYEDLGTCRPVSTLEALECGEGEFRREATADADAFCRTCPVGMLVKADCTADSDTQCGAVLLHGSRPHRQHAGENALHRHRRRRVHARVRRGHSEDLAYDHSKGGTDLHPANV